MLTSLSIANYRSILNLSIPLGRLTVITGANASGKSNIYKSLRLLRKTVSGGVIKSLAEEGGLDSVYWAGPEALSNAMRRGDVRVEPVVRKKPRRLKLGFSSDEFGYTVALGSTSPSDSFFSNDPEIKHECIFIGPVARPSAILVERDRHIVKVRQDGACHLVTQYLPMYDSMFDQLADPVNAPEVFQVREYIRGWRFYDQFRTDKDAPSRQPQLGTRTMALHHDGRDVAAAIRTIIEIGDRPALEKIIADAFPGSRLSVQQLGDGRFELLFHQYGLLRPLRATELSDGTLRFILWVAALLSPRPPNLMVLNEPETSLHPDLLPALALMIQHATEYSQIWVISHSSQLRTLLNEIPECCSVDLEKVLGQTEINNQSLFDRPSWVWPD